MPEICLPGNPSHHKNCYAFSYISIAVFMSFLQSITYTYVVDDFIAAITSIASCIYGRQTSKRRAEKMKQCVEQAMKEEAE
jgi:predicted site-specific integrase-resolvase